MAPIAEARGCSPARMALDWLLAKPVVTSVILRANQPPLARTLRPARPDDVLELDELWSFVFRRKDKRWVWLALCRRTRQIVAFAVGDRGEETYDFGTTPRSLD